MYIKKINHTYFLAFLKSLIDLLLLVGVMVKIESVYYFHD